MKKTLKEELERIHQLTYRENILEQKDFIDNIINKIDGIFNVNDNPKTADYVEPDVNELYKTLENAIENGGLSQQTKKTITFQKAVESMQIGLVLLGYELPKYGVDGLFGPETANAVKKFKQENISQINESADDIRAAIQQLGYTEKGSELDSGGEITKELSKIVIDVLKEIKKKNPNISITLTSGNDKYHQKLSYNSVHKTGQSVDFTIQPYNTQNSNDVTSILNSFKSKDPKFSYIDEYKKPSKAATGGHFHLQYGDGGNTMSKPTNVEIATPEMLKLLITRLKEKNIKSADIKKYIDQPNLQNLSQDSSFYSKLLENLGAPVTDENLKFLYAWRQAEGSGGKYNPFNTTQKMEGAITINNDGVKSYKSIEQGMIATLKTLKNGKYNCIVDGLKNDIGAEKIAQCESLKTWGTGDLVAKVIAGYNKGAKPKVIPLV